MENRKEDLAKMIARNMAAADGLDASVEPTVGVTDFGEDAFDSVSYQQQRSAVRTAKRRPSGNGSGSSGSRKSSGGSGSAHRKKSSGSRGTSSGRSTSSSKSKSSAVSKAETVKKKKKKQKISATKAMLIFTCIAVALAVSATGVYIAGRKVYDDTYLPNTYVGGVDIGGMDKKQAVAELKKNSVIPESLYITKKDGTGINIKLSDIGYVDNTEAVLEKYYNEQDHGKWVNAVFNKDEFSMSESFTYDKKMLEQQLAHKLLKDQKAKPPRDAYIKQNENGGFSVVSEDDGDTIDDNRIQLLFDYVESELDKPNFDIAIGSVDCYKKAKIHAEELADDCTKLNDLHNIQIGFDFILGTEMLDGNTIMNWVEFDENAPVNGLEVNRQAVEGYVASLSEKYDPFGKDREFNSTSRGKITVPQGQGCYGWWLDQDAMTNFIINCIENCESATTDAIYYVNPNSTYSYTCNPDWYTEESDFGDTYFDVDLEMQHLWYYEDGKMKMECDIVSGYPNESRNTPGGVYKLWLKERGKTLVGSSDGHSYASYVEFWNYISTIGIGFHDASWQNGVFGGTKYQDPTWGSHGCLNMPYDAAEYIYNNVPLDTPVFAYW